jgi:hypothetical protein
MANSSHIEVLKTMSQYKGPDGRGGEVFWKDGCEPIQVEVTVDHVRGLGREKREGFTTDQAKAVLLLYRAQITERAQEAIKSFILEKV